MDNPNIELVIRKRTTNKVLSSRQYTGWNLGAEVMGLTYSFTGSGPATLGFNVLRDPLLYWADLQPSNLIEVWYEGEKKWAGDIEGVGRKIEKQTGYTVAAVGKAAQLKLVGPPADHEYDLDPGETMSSYMIDHVLTDTALGFTQGNIASTDFEIVSGLEVFPGKAWADILDDLNKYNGYAYWVDVDSRLHFQPRRSTYDYVVSIKDCSESSLDRNRENLWNWVQYAFTPTGSIFGYVESEDTDSQERHGKRCKWESMPASSLQAEAQQVADVFIDQYSTMRPSSGVTTDIIRNTGKIKVSPFDVDANNKGIYIPDLIPLEESLASQQVTNETSTWPIAEITVDVDNKKAQFAPGNLPTRLDIMLAQLMSGRQ